MIGTEKNALGNPGRTVVLGFFHWVGLSVVAASGFTVFMAGILSAQADVAPLPRAIAQSAVQGENEIKPSDGAIIIPTPLPSAQPEPLPSVIPGHTPTAVRFSASEAKKFYSEFQKAQSSALKALEHRQRFEVKELQASQSARLKDWEKREKELRHQYFADHPKGPDRRAYVQDFLRRREALRQFMSDEMKSRLKDQEIRRQALKEEHSRKGKDFQAALAKGERPSEDLWPRPGL